MIPEADRRLVAWIEAHPGATAREARALRRFAGSSAAAAAALDRLAAAGLIERRPDARTVRYYPATASGAAGSDATPACPATALLRTARLAGAEVWSASGSLHVRGPIPEALTAALHAAAPAVLAELAFEAASWRTLPPLREAHGAPGPLAPDPVRPTAGPRSLEVGPGPVGLGRDAAARSLALEREP